MRTSTLISRSKWRPRARCSRSAGAWTLENGLTTNYAALRASALAHGPAGLPVKLRARLLSCWARRRSCVDGARTSLWCNHAPLRDDGLARCGLGRNCCRSGRSGGLRRHGGCRFICASGSGRSFRRRCNDRRGRLRLSRRRSYYDRRGRCSFLNFFLDWRSRRWRDNRRCLTGRGHNHRTFSNGRGSFRSSFFRCRRWRCSSRGGLRLRRGGDRGFHHGRGTRRGCWMLEFLLPLFQQLRDIARFGYLGKIDLWLDLWRSRPFPGGSPGLCGEVFPDFFRFIGLDRA